MLFQCTSHIFILALLPLQSQGSLTIHVWKDQPLSTTLCCQASTAIQEFWNCSLIIQMQILYMYTYFKKQAQQNKEKNLYILL